ncbi:MAG: hypothetical protein ACR2P7_00055 [bacterium]
MNYEQCIVYALFITTMFLSMLAIMIHLGRSGTKREQKERQQEIQTQAELISDSARADKAAKQNRN